MDNRNVEQKPGCDEPQAPRSKVVDEAMSKAGRQQEYRQEDRCCKRYSESAGETAGS